MESSAMYRKLFSTEQVRASTIADVPIVDVFGRPAPVPIARQDILVRIGEAVRKLRPDKIVFIHGGAAEYREITRQLVAAGDLIALNERDHPGSFLARSKPSDTARNPGRTYVASGDKISAGPLVNWISPAEIRAILDPILNGAMQGRTLYVVPVLGGPDEADVSRISIQLTDSAYVVANLVPLYGTGEAVYRRLAAGERYWFGIHATADLDPQEMYVVRFTDEGTVVSVNSDYGGNALLAKKAFGLGIASAQAVANGDWWAEHMALIELENGAGETMGVCVCKPSASGKTNDAMMRVVDEMARKGWKVRTLSDDIVYMRIGADGYLRAFPYERGFFGVALGTSNDTNPNAMAALSRDAIFTNVAVTPAGHVWWEGMSEPPHEMTDWRGRKWNWHSEGIWVIDGKTTVKWCAGSWQIMEGIEHLAEAGGKVTAAHPNSRYTARATNCPSLSPSWQDKDGIRIGAIVFEGRRKDTIPLVYQTRSWEHGVMMAAGLGAETTAAIVGQVGVVRRDPFAMGDFLTVRPDTYFKHWLRLGQRLGDKAPIIFQKNAFLRDAGGGFAWPGYAENLRVYEWIFDRALRRGNAVETPIGWMPTPTNFNLTGLPLSPDAIPLLFRVDVPRWVTEEAAMRQFFTKTLTADGGPGVPAEVLAELDLLKARLGAGSA